MSQISLNMCARRAVRVTSVFSSAAASLRVRTEREVCSAENCVKKTSGKTRHAMLILPTLSRVKLKKWSTEEKHMATHLIWCCRHPGWLLPSVYRETDRCFLSLALSLPLFSEAPASLASSPSFAGGTLDVSVRSSCIKPKSRRVDDWLVMRKWRMFRGNKNFWEYKMDPTSLCLTLASLKGADKTCCCHWTLPPYRGQKKWFWKHLLLSVGMNYYCTNSLIPVFSVSVWICVSLSASRASWLHPLLRPLSQAARWFVGSCRQWCLCKPPSRTCRLAA